MQKKSPFDIVKTRHVTEKARMLGQLQYNSSNRCVRKCVTPKYVFLVDPRANKHEIAEAIEEIYSHRKVTVLNVNTITQKPKQRRVRGRLGVAAGYKKAIVTLKAGDAIDDKIS